MLFSLCTGHKRNILWINENSCSLYRCQHVEVDSSLFVSERISVIRRRKLRHYSVIPFLLSLSAYSELTEIKMFTKFALVWYSLARLHGLKQEFFKHHDVKNVPAPLIENVSNHNTTVSYRTEPWILWTVTPLIDRWMDRWMDGWMDG